VFQLSTAEGRQNGLLGPQSYAWHSEENKILYDGARQSVSVCSYATEGEWHLNI